MLNILNAKLIVIKIGSSLLFTSNKTLRLKWVQSLVDDISLLLRQNLKIVIVTSGAIALGCKKLKINKKNFTVFLSFKSQILTILSGSYVKHS